MMSESESSSQTLSLRIPRTTYRKLEKVAEATNVSITDVATLFLSKRCNQPARRRPAGAGAAEKLLADMLRAGCSDCSTAPASVVLRVWVGASAQGEMEAFCAACASKHVSEGMALHLESDVVDAQCPGVFGEARA